MTKVRPAAVAGTFYPGSARELEAAVRHYLTQAPDGEAPAPKAIVAPHAGYVYSGPVAASAYARIKPNGHDITRVVLMGPCHRVAVRGLALSSAEAFATPLGLVPVDREAARDILALPQVHVFDPTHRDEHGLEVHLPFLQVVLDGFAVVPLVVGEAAPEAVAEVLDRLWGGPETLIVISSDLSHYLDYDTARRRDDATREAVQALRYERIGPSDACGHAPLGGLLYEARRRGLRAETLDLRNSGDTAGPRDQVVGYGAWAFGAAATASRRDEDDDEDERPIDGEDAFRADIRSLLARHGATLLHMAAASIEHGLRHGVPLPVNPAEHPGDLARDGACFVTLKQEGQLRGCVGSSVAHRPLLMDVIENSFAAAFGDPRFGKLCEDELDGLGLSLSLLSPTAALAFEGEADLIRQLRPGTDGLVIQAGRRRALFLPAVWESVSGPAAFLRHLKAKAGLPEDDWPRGLRAWRFVVEEISEDDLAGSVWSRGGDGPTTAP